MTTETHTFNTIQEAQVRQVELNTIYGSDNVIMNIGGGVYFPVEFHIFS